MVGRTGRVLSWHIFGRRGGRIDRGIIDLDLRRSNASDGCCNCRRHRSILSHTFHPAGHNTREDDDEEKFGGRHRGERSCLEIFSLGNLLAWKSSRLEIFSGLTALSSSSNFCDF